MVLTVYLFFLTPGWTLFLLYNNKNVLERFEKLSGGVNPPPLPTNIGLNLKITSLFVLLENLRSFLHLKVELQKFDFDSLCKAQNVSAERVDLS